ncbi:hypothetical protein [Pseudonocardia sp. MH-G8]|uniref:hypothetical protein n=1 Tax=Pseudonocardia sp. MH-G8 TaxID=1854588 RepID=UPI000BA03014|nr:hypothetical protein [Pseudonocardia sp. MH-G8]OZM77601.1 hypothetical protein CFP66_34655 [Pseudonocardia sp. MH-G8]
MENIVWVGITVLAVIATLVAIDRSGGGGSRKGTGVGARHHSGNSGSPDSGIFAAGFGGDGGGSGGCGDGGGGGGGGGCG